MPTIDEQLEAIQKEIRETPYHKATEHHIGKLRAKISKLKAMQMDKAARSKSSGGGGYAVKKHGDATVVLIGPPSAGKSTLINALTNAQSKIAPYAFTTLTVVPGMMKYRDAQIQILDVPGLIEGAEEGKGRGKEVLSVARGADLVILMTDFERPHIISNLEDALYRNGIRLNSVPPQVRVDKKLNGGLSIRSNIHQELSMETIKEVANELGPKNAEITIMEPLTVERLIDAFSANRVYAPALYLINKTELMTDDDKRVLEDTIGKSCVFISAEHETGLEELRDTIWEKLQFVKVFLIRPDEEPHTGNPMIMRAGDTLETVADKISGEFREEHEQAQIWGPGAKFEGQKVSLTVPVLEGMYVRFI